jgi:hypothetical protein
MLTSITSGEETPMTLARTMTRRLWDASRPLTAVGFAMLFVFALSLAGLLVDQRLVGGAPVWLKPAKFAISTAIYALTFAWIFTYLRSWPRLTRIVGVTTAAILVLEVALIDVQAARGTTSHFNVGTWLDGLIYGVMGSAILIAWAASVALTVALFRQRFTDEALGWAIRLGLLITVLGSATGGLMTRPTDSQLATARTTHRVAVVGAHTVGAADGGPGLPGTGWSLGHGDLRVPHFIGLHAVQVLPLLAWLIRRVAPVGRRRAVLLGAISYVSLFVILLWQALSGHPVFAPGGAALTALLLWAAATAIGLPLAMASSRLGTHAGSMDIMVS